MLALSSVQPPLLQAANLLQTSGFSETLSTLLRLSVSHSQKKKNIKPMTAHAAAISPKPFCTSSFFRGLGQVI